MSAAARAPLDARFAVACRCVYGASVAGLGVLVAITGDLRAVFQPVAAWVPLPRALAYATALLLVGAGLALFAFARRAAALALTVNFFVVWLVLFHVPTVVMRPTAIGSWEGCGLTMGIAAGSWILASGSHRAPPRGTVRLFGERGATQARRLFAAGMPLVGLAHFADAAGAASDFVPSWLPARTGWVYLTGAGHIAAGAAILTGVLPLLAASLEAAQITAFVLVTHVPAVFAAPRDLVQWAMLLHAAAIGAAAWLIVLTYRGGAGA